MKTITLASGERLQAPQLTRKGVLPEHIVDAARGIVAAVRERGDEALRGYCRDLDGVDLETFRLPAEALDHALDHVDDAFRAALEKAAAQIRDFHEREVQQSWFTTRADGTMLGVKVTPVAAAGIYVPGGRAQYPSTVLMNAVPAKVAGVPRIVMVTPPQKDADPVTGGISPYTLAAAKVAGVDEVYTVGGAQAVAALAYGTESVPKVDKITGPGNAYVAAAKQIVSGDVGIDMVAGPSEVCVLADATANPMVVAADLMAQAEHDPLAACYLVTCDASFAAEVERGIDLLVAQSPRAEITRTSLDNEGTIVVAADLDAAVDAVNTIAPEHLELHCADALGLLGSIRNAGAIFVGAWSSEPLGDYVAGPNHTLPTGGTAVFSSPLSVDDFIKKSSVICYTPAGLLRDAPATQTLAQGEGLWAHALSTALRRRALEQGKNAVSYEALAQTDLTQVAWPKDDAATVAAGASGSASAEVAGAAAAGVNGREA
ncbi:histidinol dehydrogenase [Collinsella sp. An2]|uniref:histidinol dehydrogenase n=1 Tax=Collinsella sp. An2 TaxID=1965585 RepID=UPI000B38B556|nr:histidinol dehydrogenase [Collinsella sp. An2]OUP06409.1 histidinol dehydrogenase [Collinsella sp. An2]